jgi:uncharacterized protein (DUF1684 family)
MKSSLVTLLIFCIFDAAGQPAYADSLYQYQHQYKKDLSEIIQKDTAYVRFYTPDPAYRVLATVELLEDQPFFAMRTSSGKPRQAKKYARVSFTLNNKTHKLFAYQLSELLGSEEYKDNFFIPFLDAGSGEQTYGGGRYLDFTTKDVINKTLLIDFNKAYNPYCAFVSGYQCPIPPRENMLAARVEAGEKAFAKATKK